MLAVTFCYGQENASYQDDRNEQGTDVLGDGDVPLADVVRVCFTLFKVTGVVGIVALEFDDTAFGVFLPAHGIAIVGGLAVVELVRQEDHGAALVEQNDGQRDGDAFFTTTADVPAIAVDDVLYDERTGVKHFLLCRFRHRFHIIRLSRFCCLGKPVLARENHQQCTNHRCQFYFETFITHTFIISYLLFQNLLPLNLKSRAIYDFSVYSLFFVDEKIHFTKMLSLRFQIITIMKKVIHTNNAPAAIGPYSQAIEANGMLFISGQIPVNPADGTVPEGITAQTEQVMKNIAAILDEAGYTFDNVVKTTCLLSDIANFGAMNEVYATRYFGAMNEVYATRFPSNPPARAAFAVRDLPKGVMVEIEVIAAK